MILSQTALNRIKIKDLMAAVKRDLDTNNGMGLVLLESMERREKLALEKATDDDVRWVERIFIENKLGIKYYPSQNKKTIPIKGRDKIVPIDYIYGSENA